MLVSVIIPCFNAAEDITECIDAVLSQSYQEIEIILIDNNSSDGTLDILLEYQEKYPHKIQALKESKQGAPAARNKGLSLAKGEWLQFLDADDLLFPDKISNQISLLSDSEDAQLIVANYYHQLNNGIRLKFEYLKDNPWLAFVKTRLGITSCYLWKKDIVIDVGGWNENMPSSQEYELIFKLLKKDVKITYDPSYLTLVRRREASISTQENQVKVWSVLIDQRLRMRSYLKKTKPDIFRNQSLQIDRALIGHLSALGLCDLEKANAIFKREFKNAPFLKKSPNGKMHQLSYNIFGFWLGTIIYKNYIAFLRLINRYHY